MNVLLIALPNEGMKWVPLNLLYLAGILDEHGIDCTIADWNIIGEGGVTCEIMKRYDVVGLSVLSSTRWDAFDYAEKIRRISPQSLIVMGGVHATLMPEQCKRFCDVVIKGDGEGPFLDVCQGKSPVERVLPIDSLRPAWGKLDLWRYPGKGFTTHDRRKANGIDISRSPRISMQTSRSCQSHCRFCSSFYVQGKYRMRTPSRVVDDIELLYSRGFRHFYFVDDSFYLDKAKGLEFCREIWNRGLRIAFHIQTRADVLDWEYTQALADAGCYYVSIGVETGAESVMSSLHKSTEVNASFEAIQNCRRVGIRTEALLIVGNEGETDETIEETRRFLKRARPTTVSSAEEGLLLFPGTAVYQKALKEGLISPDFWESRERCKVYLYPPETIRRWNERVYTHRLLPRLRWYFKKLERML